MKRAECLTWPPCMHPDQVCVRNTEDWRHNEPYIHYQLRSQLIMSEGHDVLNVDIFNGYQLEGRYFADRDTGSHIALVIEKGEWTRCILQNVVNTCAGLPKDYNETASYWGGCSNQKWVWASSADEARSNQYFGRNLGYKPWKYGLQTWESELQRDRRIKQLNNKQVKINEQMEDLILPVPEDFYRWVHEEVFGQKYLSQERNRAEKKTALSCSACGNEWEQARGVKSGTGTCPKCGAQVRVINGRKAERHETLFLLQPCRGREKWAERIFAARCFLEQGNRTFVKLDEQIRIIIDKGKDWGTCFYEDFIDSGGNPQYWDTNRHSLYAKAGYLYPGTLEDCAGLMPEKLKNAGLKGLAAGMVKANYNNIITTWHSRPWFEYMAKGGFTRIISETAKSAYGDSHGTGMLGQDGKNMEEVFRISRSRIDRLRQMGGGYKALSWLQEEERTGKKISEENMQFLTKHFWPDSHNVKKTMHAVGSANVFANYVRKQAGEAGETVDWAVTTWADYLDMAEKQGLNLKHEMFYKPKNLKAAHDACVREAQMQEGRKRASEILEKFPDVEKNMDAVRGKYTYAGDEFCILVPEGIPDIIHEGRALGHCIDSTDRYFDRINQNISYLVFLRRTSAPTVPYYTLEIEPGGTIRQQRTTGNNQNRKDLEEYGPFIREWQKEVRRKLTEEDRKLAEQSRSVRIEEYRELREKKEKVWHGKLAGQLLADVLESDLIENIM